jgi:penicillin amidase
VGQIVGFDGTALFFEDTNRSQPSDGRVTVPGFLGSIGGIGKSSTESVSRPAKATIDDDSGMSLQVSESTLLMAMDVQDRFSKSPILSGALKPRERFKGSNEWAVSGAYTESGYPLMANDPHIALDTPATFYESNLAHEMGEDSYAVSGVGFPGIPGIAQGCNDRICWGSTVHPMDVTDVFADEILRNALTVPTHTVHNGEPEPITHIYQSYFVNLVGDSEPDNLVRANIGLEGGVSFVSPRRNNGPLIGFSGNMALFVQYTGWGPTSDLKFFHDAGKATRAGDRPRI